MRTGKLVAVAMAAAGTILLVTGCNGLSGADNLVVGTEHQGQSKDPTNPGKPRAGDGDEAPANGKPGEPGKPGAPGSTATPSSSTSSLNIQCGGDTCSGATPFCCESVDGPSRCAGIAEPCFGAVVTCGGPSDCQNGDVCCAFFPDIAQCAPSAVCTGIGTKTLCRDDNDCDNHDTCTDHLLAFGRNACE